MTLAPDLTYATVRAMRVLEVLAFAPMTAPRVAAALHMHPRTIRRALRALLEDGYVERWRLPTTGYCYQPTMHMIALAAQFARHLPLVRAGERIVAELHADTGRGVYLAAPAYTDVLVFAAAGNEVPRLWELRAAAEDAAGRALLAHRESWRTRFALGSATSGWLAEVRTRGYASYGQATAVPVASDADEPPVAALVLVTPNIVGGLTPLIGKLNDAAARLAEQLAPVESLR